MTNYIKYPRSFHLPWSRGYTHDDKVAKNIEHFIGKEVVVTEKLDGEGTTLYKDYMHARSIHSANHPSRNWVKTFHASFAYRIQMAGAYVVKMFMQSIRFIIKH